MSGRVADALSVSGRSQPYPDPLPDGFAHRFTFWPSASTIAPGIIVRCDACQWRMVVDGGHDLPDLIRLAAQHNGVADVTQVITEALLSLLGHEIGQP